MAKLNARSNSIEKRDGTVIKLTSVIQSGRGINKAYEIHLKRSGELPATMPIGSRKPIITPSDTFMPPSGRCSIT
jgi:hypothetical protein